MFYEKYIIEVQTCDKEGQLCNALFHPYGKDNIVLFGTLEDAVKSVRDFCSDTSLCIDLFTDVSDNFDIEDDCYIDFMIGKMYLNTDSESGVKCEVMYVHGVAASLKPVKILTYKFEKTVEGWLSD